MAAVAYIGAMSETVTKRPPPEVIRVPPPEGVSVRPHVAAVFALVLLIAGVVGVCLGLVLRLWVIWLGVAAFVACAMLFAWGRHAKARNAERHRAYLADLRERGVDPTAYDLAARWKPGGKAVPDDDVKAILASSPTPNPPGARIVCLGEIDVPEVGELFFEPEIITPTRAVGWQLVFAPIAAIVIFVWLMQAFGVIPGRGINPGSFGYILVMGVGAGAMWLWRTVLRPTYIRMAPGMIQILEFRYRRGKPTIRSYPLDAGTIAVLRGKATGGKTSGLKLALLREVQQDTVELWRMQKRDKAIERTWQALLSTAPTPPLSDEGLVG